MKNKLTPKQQKFCIEYVKDLNATQAAIRAGYSERTASQQGQRLLSNVQVQGELTKGVQQSFGMSQMEATKVVEMIGAMAEVDPLDIFDANGEMKPLDQIPKAARQCISGISHGKYGITVKLEGRLKALELMGKYLKLWSDGVNVNVDSGDGPTKVVFDFTGSEASHV